MTLARAKGVTKPLSRNKARFAAIDFETADHGSDSACAVGVVVVEGTRIVERHYSLLRPPRRQFRFTHVHGITWDDVADAPSFRDHWPQLSGLLRDAEFIAAHNASFDKRVLEACCEKARVHKPNQPFTCTVKLARATWDLESAKLSSVCEHLGIELDHHHALSDALACARIVIASRRVRTT